MSKLKMIVVMAVVLAASALQAVSEIISLPPDYQRVEWIGSTGTQYILLDEVPGPTLGTRMEFNSCTYKHQSTFFGVAWSGSSYLFDAQSGNFSFFGGGATLAPFANDTEYVIEITPTTSPNGLVRLTKMSDGTVTEKTYSLAYSGSNKLGLFACSNGGFSAPFKCRRVTLSRNGQVVRDYIPCYEKANSDNAGLYDLVGKNFLGNNGKGMFEKGADILDGAFIAVAGSPEDIGVVSPAYGKKTSVVSGQTYDFDAPAWTNDTETVAATCVGWTYVEKKDGETLAETQGTGSHVSIAYQGGMGLLTWQWQLQYKVTASGGEFGTVTNASAWVDAGGRFNTRFDLNAGVVSQAFFAWKNAAGETVGKDPSLSVVITKPETFTVSFQPTLYVATDGNDANDGTTPDTPLLTIEAALARVKDDSGMKILVAPGTYTATNYTADVRLYALTIDKPNVSLIATGGPSVTTIDAGKDKQRAEANICAEGAFVSGFSFINGCYKAKFETDGLTVSAGTVSNCYVNIRDQWAGSGFLLRLSSTAKVYDIVIGYMKSSGTENGAAISLEGDALLDGLVMTNFLLSGSACHRLIDASGNSRVRNALIAGCQMGSIGASSLPSFVYLKGNAALEDSTIANNTLLSPYGAIQIDSASATVTNCVIWRNETMESANCDFRAGKNKARVFRTCSAELTADATGNTPQDPQFVNLADGDYRLRAISRVADRGAAWLRPSGAASFECAADTDAYVSESGKSLSVTLSGYTSEGDEDVEAVWNFGDGTTSTDWPTVQHTFKAPGAYTVSVTVKKGEKTATFTFQRQFVTTPATCYVKEGNTGVFPYETWEKAASTLAAAYDVGSRTIIVTNGNYEIPAPQMSISRPVSIISVEGPEKTMFTSLGGTTCDHRHFTVTGSDDILISGFTLNDGYALTYYWTAAIEMGSGTLSNCVVRGTRRVSRAPANKFYGTAKAVDCRFDGLGMGWSNDQKDQNGVRLVDSAVLDRCEIRGYRIENNTTASGYDGESPVCIDSANAVLRNSLVHFCTNGITAGEKYRGPVALLNGRIENCTIVDNHCGGYGGGVWAKGGTIVNSIVCNNTALMDPEGCDLRSTSASAQVSYTVASGFKQWQAGAGVGCSTKLPIFDATNPYHLTALATSCVNKGSDEDSKGAYDLDRLERIHGDAVDLGCYEFQGSTDIPLDGAIATVGSAAGRAPFAAVLEVSPVGDTNGLKVVWNFGTGEPVLGGLLITNVYEQFGAYTVSASLSNDKGEAKTITLDTPVTVVPAVCYVSPDGSAQSPYATWETAATDIMDAIALNPKTVLVTNGTYAVSGDGIVLSTDLELRSVNGPDVTFIDAQNVCRNVMLTGEDAVCDGFSLIRGTGYYEEKSIFARVQAGTLSHCILSNGYSGTYRDAAVVVKGTGRMVDCVVDTANMGGNADCGCFWGTLVNSGGVIERCTIQRYNYTNQGGSGNSHFAVHVEGTGIFRNCLVRDCTTTQSGNSATVYRGAIGVMGAGTVANCTIVNTKSCQEGGAITILSAAKNNPTVHNNICWNSTLADGSVADDVRDVVAATPRVSYTRANNLKDGENGNLTADPIFATRKSRPTYSLGSASPCINAGLYQSWMEGATDIVGAPRLIGKRPDLGCYECPSNGFLLIVR